MNKTEARERIRQLNDAHESDHDGGYALVEELKQAHGEVEPEGRVLFAEALSDFVRNQDPQLWAVALEALVQLGANREVASLGEEVGQSSRNEKWKDNVVLGLLRLGQGQFHDAIVEHVLSSLESPRHLTVPILAALCRIDRSACLEISSAYFESAHVDERESDVEGFIPAFVRNFIAVDDELLSELVRMVARKNPESARWLGRCLNEYLSKPWMLEELGDGRSTRVRTNIHRAANGMN